MIEEAEQLNKDIQKNVSNQIKNFGISQNKNNEDNKQDQEQNYLLF